MYGEFRISITTEGDMFYPHDVTDDSHVPRAVAELLEPLWRDGVIDRAVDEPGERVLLRDHNGNTCGYVAWGSADVLDELDGVVPAPDVAPS